MASGKDIKRRIKSIDGTRKITRAMEMVSAAKMRRAVASLLNMRPYAHSAWRILTNLARAFENYKHGFLEVREVRNILILVVASDRGLCGSFNSQLYKKIREQLQNPQNLKVNRIGKKRIDSTVEDKDLKMDFVAIGKKGENIVRRLKGNLVASFPDSSNFSEVSAIRPILRIVADDYLAKKYDKVVIVYTDYVSAMVQQAKVRQILPISKIDLEKQIAEIDVLAKEYGLNEPLREYKIEPSPEEVLGNIFPKIIEMQILHAVLESNASEHSARMLAMRNATEAAGEMSEDLNLAYNQLRQAKITQEIAEISAGSAALE